jgi:hypothetical protein
VVVRVHASPILPLHVIPSPARRSLCRGVEPARPGLGECRLALQLGQPDRDVREVHEAPNLGRIVIGEPAAPSHGLGHRRRTVVFRPDGRRLIIPGRRFLHRQPVPGREARRRGKRVRALTGERALGGQSQQAVESLAFGVGEGRYGCLRFACTAATPSRPRIGCIVVSLSLTNGQFTHQGASSAIVCD